MNPLTAIALNEAIVNRGNRAAVQTGACSQLGRMIINLCKESDSTLINIVRRDEQVKILKEEYDQKYVLNSTDADFEERFAETVEELNAFTLLECVSGETTGQLLKFMPYKTHCILYGALSKENVGGISPFNFIGKSQTIEGFLMPEWLKTKSLYRLWRIIG